MKYYSANHLEPIEEVINDGISGSGSCFPAGTFVRTQHGYTPIETLKPNDIIIGYDRFGELEFGIIKQVFKHIGSDISHDLYDFHNGMPLVTGNHAIYDNITNEHKEAQDFNINESFTLMDGSQVIIDEISIQPKEEYSADFTVYNLEVLPMHTYLVSSDGIDWFKVHNGGGGKGGTPHVATEAADTLRSAAIARVLEVISEGEIEGIVGGAKGVYINNTPLQNTDNTYNFTNVVFDSRNGLPSQEKINWFPDAESEFQKDVTVTASTPVIQSITTSGVDFAKITLSLPNGLYVQNKTNGDVNGNTIAYKIDVRSTVGGTGSWQSVIDKSLTGKTMSNYEFTHRITAPAATWDVRVSRISADDPDTASQSDLKFARWTEIQSTTETYNNSAVAAISIPSESVGNQIPNRAYDVMGIKVQVPVNYDPITRVYSGSWNGLFKTAWTDNTAWILYDLITNTRYGIANYMNTPVAVDKWAFYDAAVYNDGLVPNGMGGYEVRYCFNNVIQTQEDAWQLLHAVASNMRANISMNSNLISIVQDRPTAATKILNNSNVLDGIFNYSTTDSSQRITAVNITFNDKDDHYLPRTISLVNTTSGASNTVDYNNGIEKWGYNVQDFTAYGSVTESFAKRLAKWVLYTEAKQEDIVSFGLALNSIDVGIGDVVKIMDND
jgi:predicted phage tail protein